MAGRGRGHPSLNSIPPNMQGMSAELNALLNNPNIELNNAMKTLLLSDNHSGNFQSTNHMTNANLNMMNTNLSSMRQPTSNQFGYPLQQGFGLPPPQMNTMSIQNLYHPAPLVNQAAAIQRHQQQSPQPQKQQPQQPMSGHDFLKALGSNMTPPQQHIPQTRSPAPSPHISMLSVSASEFVPTFRKPEKKIELYTYESFKKKSRVDDALAINDVKTKLVKLFNCPQSVDDVMMSAVDTIKNWTTSIDTYHQIVEDIFEFSIDEANHPNFYPIGSKILSYLTLQIPPFGEPPITFFDTVIQKSSREFDNCIKMEPFNPAAQERIKNVALMIADLFNTIKEGDLRVFMFAEQVVNLCTRLTEIRTILSIETVAKIFLLCGGDLKGLVDELRFNSIINNLVAVSKLDLDSKTRVMVENVIRLNQEGWLKEREEPAAYKGAWSSNTGNSSVNSSGDCRPVTNPDDWDDYANDEFDDEWLTEMLRFEEEDDFSDVEEDFKKFMEEAQKYKN